MIEKPNESNQPEKLKTAEKETAKKPRQPLDQWAAINNELRLYKLSTTVLTGITCVLAIMIGVVCFRDPVVVLLDREKKVFLHGAFQGVKINEDDVADFVHDFVESYYTWERLNPDEITSQLAPLTTSGLNEKVRGILFQLRDKELKDKKVSQGVTNIKVQVSEEKVVATFDRLIRIEGIPLPIPTQISLNIISGSKTAQNPRGLYVNGLIEHEEVH